MIWERTKYSNFDKSDVKVTFKTFFKWQKNRLRKKKDLSYLVPQAYEKKIAFLLSNRMEISLTWVGHATFLIQLDGLNILTDPVWANRMGLEKRLSKPGLELTNLPAIDVVVISHNHFDHLDFNSLYRLKGNPLYFIPKGMKTLFKRKNICNTREFNWWEQAKFQKVQFTFTPSQHWSKRAIFDTNTSLWGSWVIDNSFESFFFVGDSGYFRGFKEIGSKFKIKYFLGPIGCYDPEWLTKLQHMTPEETIQAFLDCKAEKFIPMHYDAFRLADDTPEEALERLLKDWEKRGLAENNLIILKLGETIFCK